MAESVDIVVPVYNEESCVEEFLRRVDRLGLLESLIFVDNASTDATVGRLEQYPNVRIVRHARNLGYGASIRDGIAHSAADRVIIIDADLEYPPEAIPDILAALDTSPVVYGSRFAGPGRPPMPWVRRAGNQLISRVFNLLFRQSVTDLYTGMKGLRRDVVDPLHLERDGFEHVVELGACLAAAGIRIDEVPVTYTPRSLGVSKMRHGRETAKFFGWLLLYWWRFALLGRRAAAPTHR